MRKQIRVFWVIILTVGSLMFLINSGSQEEDAVRDNLKKFIISGKENIPAREIFGWHPSSYQEICLFSEENSDPKAAERKFHRYFSGKNYQYVQLVPNFENASVTEHPSLYKAFREYVENLWRDNYSVIIAISSGKNLNVIPLKSGSLLVNGTRYFIRFDSLQSNRGFEGCLQYNNASFKVSRPQETSYLLLSNH